jgi:hypothetical protein
MNVFAHAIAERRVDELVLTDFRLPSKKCAHDDGFEVPAVTGNFDVLTFQTILDALLDQIGVHCWSCGYRLLQKMRMRQANDAACILSG